MRGAAKQAEEKKRYQSTVGFPAKLRARRECRMYLAGGGCPSRRGCAACVCALPYLSSLVCSHNTKPRLKIHKRIHSTPINLFYLPTVAFLSFIPCSLRCCSTEYLYPAIAIVNVWPCVPLWKHRLRPRSQPFCASSQWGVAKRKKIIIKRHLYLSSVSSPSSTGNRPQNKVRRDRKHRTTAPRQWSVAL